MLQLAVRFLQKRLLIAKGLRRISGRAQDTTRGGVTDSVLQQQSKTRDAYSKYRDVGVLRFGQVACIL